METRKLKYRIHHPSGRRRKLPPEKRNALIIGGIVLALVAGILFIPGGGRSKARGGNEFSQVEAIGELATLRCFYHNVATFEEKGDDFVNNILLFPFGGYAKVGHKQYWIEYSGIIEVGVDADLIRTYGPDSEGVVRVYVPEARIMNVYADEKTLSEPFSSTGWFTSISGAEKTQAFSAAQSKMREEAEKDTGLLRRARNNARLLVEQYIINVGKEIGAAYTVKWLEKPISDP